LSDNNHYTGAITITPAVRSARRIRQAPETEDARLRVTQTVIDGDEDEVISLVADAIEPACDGFSGHSLVDDIQRLH
jgi:hypothetical protein